MVLIDDLISHGIGEITLIKAIYENITQKTANCTSNVACNNIGFCVYIDHGGQGRGEQVNVSPRPGAYWME